MEPIFERYYIHNYRSGGTGEKEHINLKPFIFTDRSIYRPGQTVYFKGILLKSQGAKSEIVPNEFVEVYLDDVNSQEVNMLRLKTNDFGSFSGEFALSAGGLTGEYTIRVEEDYEEDSRLYDLMDDF